MKGIAFVLITCAYEITSSKLPLASTSVDEHVSSIPDKSSTTQHLNEDSLNTARDISSDYGSYYGYDIPTDYGNFNSVSSWVDSYAPTYPYYNTQTYYPISTEHSQGQWSSHLWPYDRYQYTSSNANPYYMHTNTADRSDGVGTVYPASYRNYQYQHQPRVEKKTTTVFNPGEPDEIKLKVVISPEHHEPTGYIAFSAPGANNNSSGSSKDGKIVYRF